MTKLKGLFLGSAAAILAVTGAHAADAPAEVFDYVRICDAYGTKYYYIPGTETCLRIGGYLQWRATAYHNDSDWAPRGRNQAIALNETNFDLKGRARLWLDAREETEWGTLRGYMEYEANDGGALIMRHAYLQIAGITAGHTSTLMNYLGHGGGPLYLTISGDNGVSRNQLINYTVNFGNGFSIAAGFEESDVTDTFYVGAAAGGDDLPDFAARLSVEQGWGAFGVSGMIRDDEVWTAALGDEREVGWAARAALKINLDFLANGGSIGGMATYTHGASNYAADYAPDGVFTAATNDLDLVDTWSARAALEIGVTPTLSAGLWGGYTTVVDVEDTLVAVGDSQTETWWNIGGTVTWNPLTNLVIGMDVAYEHQNDVLRTAATTFADRDANNWMIAVGMQRNF
ncbi:MAG: porin [Rhodobiaceae bacterium]|nr:porin [Rhodobiaceae bacterium]